MRSDHDLRWPKLTGSPVLNSIRPVIEHSRDVETHIDKIAEVAGWMAYEELPIPDYALPFGIGAGDRNETIDFILTAACIDTAFTDFSSHIKFQVEDAGRTWSDSDALVASNIELPMLDEKPQILHQVGTVLATKYNGRFHNFVASCSPKLYDNGDGLVDRLVSDFPRFRDVSLYNAHTVNFYKLPQLAIWFLYTSLRKTGKFCLEDLETMSAFADYIVPVALRLLGITSYSSALENAINSYKMIPHDSPLEVEIGGHCIYASALLAEEINHLRPSDQQIVIPQIDARLWTHYHTTWWPHHLTKTIMY